MESDPVSHEFVSLMEKFMKLQGLDVVSYLNGPDTVRDGSLVSLSVERIATEPVIELTFEVRRRSVTSVVKVELRDIQEFDFSYAKDNPPVVIEFMKCLMTDGGDFYLSLDPYNEHEVSISEKDNDFFRAGTVTLWASVRWEASEE